MGGARAGEDGLVRADRSDDGYMRVEWPSGEA